jgi:hypothetical protein
VEDVRVYEDCGFPPPRLRYEGGGGEHLQERERIWKKHLLEVDCFNLKLLWIFFFFFLDVV